MNPIGIAIVCAALAGCAISTRERLPDGTIQHVTFCSGVGRSWAMCQQIAQNICGVRGYNIVATTGDTGLIGSAADGATQFFNDMTIARVMTVTCK